MAREDKHTAAFLFAELARNNSCPASVEVVALLEYLECLAEARFGGPAEFSRMSSYFRADDQSTPLSLPRPVRSAPIAPCLWDDILNEGE